MLYPWPRRHVSIHALNPVMSDSASPSRPAAPPFRTRHPADLAGFRVRPRDAAAVRGRRSGHPRAAARHALSRDGLRAAAVRVRAGRRGRPRGHPVRRLVPALSRCAPRRLALQHRRGRRAARHDQGPVHACVHRVRVRRPLRGVGRARRAHDRRGHRRADPGPFRAAARQRIARRRASRRLRRRAAARCRTR